MYENRAEDLRALTIAAANAGGMVLGGEPAHREWLANQAVPVSDDSAAAKQAGAVMRLRDLFGSQLNPVLRDAIRVRKSDA